MRRLLASAFAVAVVLSAVPASAYEPVTEGDVRAQFQAVENGGAVVFDRFGPENTIPPASPLLHSIRPIAAFFDGRHYCTLDWQLITIAVFGSPEEFGLSTTKELKALLEATTVTFNLDGVEVPAVETTSVKTAKSDFFGSVAGATFWRAWGNFYAPGVLTVGSHSLTGSITFPILGTFQFDTITFFVDPVGSGACS